METPVGNMWKHMLIPQNFHHFHEETMVEYDRLAPFVEEKVGGIWIFKRDHGFIVHVPWPRRILPEVLSQGKRNHIEFLALPGNQTWLASCKIP